MPYIQLTQDMDHQGLSEGDVLRVDQRSAEALIEAGQAEAYDPAEAAAEREPTVDDIPSTAKGGQVMCVNHVGQADPGPAAPPAADEADDAGHVEGEPVEDGAAGEPATVSVDGAEASELPPPDAAPRSKRSATGKSPAASGAQPAGGDSGGGRPGK